MINRLQVLQKSFSARIFLTLILTMVCMAVLFDFIFISMQKKNYQIIHGAHATTTVRMFAHTIRLAVFIEDIEEMLAPVEGLLRQDDVIEVVIWNKEGKALLQKTKKPAGKMYIKTDSMDLQMVLDYRATRA